MLQFNVFSMFSLMTKGSIIARYAMDDNVNKSLYFIPYASLLTF